MPASLAKALQIDVERLRWWEWDLWAADDAHITTSVINEFRATYRDMRAYQQEVADHMPKPVSRADIAKQTGRGKVPRRARRR